MQSSQTDALTKTEQSQQTKATVLDSQFAEHHDFEQNLDQSINQQKSDEQLPLSAPTNLHDSENNDFAHAGVLVDSLDISVKQWQFQLHWQKTNVPKSGLLNRLKKRQRPMDLDLSCLLCNRYGEVLERIWFKNVRDQAESIRYQGDELIGDRVVHFHTDPQPTEEKIEPKYESMALYLSQIPPQVYQVVMVLSSYTGDDLNKVIAGECVLSDDEGNMIANVNLTKLPENTPAIWVATLTRSADSWYFIENKQPLKHYKQLEFEQEISEQLRQAC